MPAEITPPAPAMPEELPPHPGDIIQVTDSGHNAFPAILVVHEVRAAHVEAHAMVALTQNRSGPARLKPGQFAVVGAAALLPPDLLKARQASIATAELVARERG